MLTSIPPQLLHRVRDAAAYVHDLAQLGLAILCPCDDDHGAGARWLTGQDDMPPVCSSCTRPPDALPAEWVCDPDRPGCPLHAIPEVTR